MDMVGNSKQDSSFIAVFEDAASDTNGPIYFDAILGGRIGDYKEMNCVVELDMSSNRPAVERVFPVPVIEYVPRRDTESSPLVGFIGMSIGNTGRPGRFRLVCSYVPMENFVFEEAAGVYASFSDSTQESFATTRANIRSDMRFVTTLSIFIADKPRGEVSSTFILSNPKASGNYFLVGPPIDPRFATTASNMLFRHGTADPYAMPCLGFWDGVLRPDSALAKVHDGEYDLGLKIELAYDIQTAKEIKVVCPDLYGEKENAFLPTISASYFPQSLYSQTNYSLVATPEDD